MVLTSSDIEQICLEIMQNYAFDLSGYAPASLNRRITKFMLMHELINVTFLLEKLSESKPFFEEFLSEITVNTTEMFRDTDVWKEIKNTIIPTLKNKKQIKIWHSACSSGQEPLSMAILLDQADLLASSHIMATDLNPMMLEIAKNAAYSFRKVEMYEQNYKALNLAYPFSNYYKLKDGNGYFHERLLKPIQYTKQNLLKINQND